MHDNIAITINVIITHSSLVFLFMLIEIIEFNIIMSIGSILLILQNFLRPLSIGDIDFCFF
jgi:hypothetical protein